MFWSLDWSKLTREACARRYRPTEQAAVDSKVRFGLNYPSFLRPGTREVHVEASAAVTVRDVAAYLNVDAKTVYRLASRGELPGFKVAGTWRFKRADIDVWIDEQKKRRAKTRRSL
jgi:excisionase family DNA binding protein